MRMQPILSAIAASILMATIGLALAQSGAGGVGTLRGADVEDAVAPLELFQLEEGRFTRNYRQQPPLIPHSIDQYQIDMNANRCLSCHDWKNAAERRAPTLSMTHYLDRDGNQLDTISGSRWFCNQCHVPQADAPELVDNTFQSSSGN